MKRRQAESTVTEVTRRAIIDDLRLGRHWWAGQCSEVDFLKRLFPLDELPSTDGRFSTMSEDVWQHRERNHDWDDHWLFTDSRLELESSDAVFLRVLCEMLHPVVRKSVDDAKELGEMFNEHLKHDGWSIVPVAAISGRPVYGARQGAKTVIAPPERLAPVDHLSDQYIGELSEKCEQRLSSNDLDGAVTAARTMLEAVLFELQSELIGGPREDFRGDLPKLFRQVIRAMHLDDTRPDLDERYKDVVRGLVQIVGGLAPLRNKISDSHARAKVPAPHHARLVVNAVKTIAAFLVSSFHAQRQRGRLPSAAP